MSQPVQAHRGVWAEREGFLPGDFRKCFTGSGSVAKRSLLRFERGMMGIRGHNDPGQTVNFTGRGLMGRHDVNIRSSDVVGGSSGTLGELAIAYDEGKLISVLTGTGGISTWFRTY